MKDILLRIRCWISWHAMPKDVRPYFEKAVSEFAKDLTNELEELVKEMKEQLENERKGEE